MTAPRALASKQDRRSHVKRVECGAGPAPVPGRCPSRAGPAGGTGSQHRHRLAAGQGPPPGCQTRRSQAAPRPEQTSWRPLPLHAGLARTEEETTPCVRLPVEEPQAADESPPFIVPRPPTEGAQKRGAHAPRRPGGKAGRLDERMAELRSGVEGSLNG